MNQKINNYLSIDIGTSKINCVICQLDKDNNLDLKGVGESGTSGIEDGVIVQTNELYKAIERAIKRASVDAGGLTSNQVIMNIPSKGIHSLEKTSVIISQDPSNQIEQFHQKDSLKQIKQQLPQDKTVLHILPYEYQVDGIKVKNPVGVFGKTLDTKACVIVGNENNINQLRQIFKNLNCIIKGIVYTPLGLIEMLIKEKPYEKIGLIDIGGNYTIINQIKNKQLIKTEVIPLGGDLFTWDISECLKVTIPEAERLKVLYGNVNINEINPQDKIMIMTKENHQKEIAKYLLCQIIQARFLDLIAKIKSHLSINEQDGWIFTGNGSLLKGIEPLMKSYGAKEVMVGMPTEYKPIIEKQDSLAAIGLLFYAIKNQAISFESISLSRIGIIKRWFSKVF